MLCFLSIPFLFVNIKLGLKLLRCSNIQYTHVVFTNHYFDICVYHCQPKISRIVFKCSTLNFYTALSMHTENCCNHRLDQLDTFLGRVPYIFRQIQLQRCPPCSAKHNIWRLGFVSKTNKLHPLLVSFGNMEGFSFPSGERKL